MLLTGRRALITGAGSGVGRELALRLATPGSQIASSADASNRCP